MNSFGQTKNRSGGDMTYRELYAYGVKALEEAGRSEERRVGKEC